MTSTDSTSSGEEGYDGDSDSEDDRSREGNEPKLRVISRLARKSETSGGTESLRGTESSIEHSVEAILSDAENKESPDHSRQELIPPAGVSSKSEITGKRGSQRETMAFTEQSGNTTSAPSDDLGKTTANSQSNDDTAATSQSSIRSSNIDPAPSPQQTSPNIHLQIVNVGEYSYMDRAPASELFRDCLLLDALTGRNLIGSGSFGRVHAVKVIRCRERVMSRLIQLSHIPGDITKLLKDYQVALKVFTWKGKDCVCSDCKMKNQTRRAQGLLPLKKYLPAHIVECSITRSMYNEVISLKALIGLSGIQQIIGYEVDMIDNSAKLVTRLEGKPLIQALQNYPASFASGNPEGAALILFALTMQAVSNIHSQRVLHNDFSCGNLLFDQHLNPVIIDFGMGRPYEICENGLEVLCFAQTGTTYYASHEALICKTRGGNFQGYTSTKADVHAVAAVLFNLVFCKDRLRPQVFRTAVEPIAWDRRLKLVFYSIDGNDPIRSSMRFVLGGLYLQCLQYDPLMRPSAATAVRNARQFAQIILRPDACEALYRVLDGTLKHYPWELLSMTSLRDSSTA